MPIDKEILEASIHIVTRAFEDCLTYATAIKSGLHEPINKEMARLIQRAAGRAEVLCKGVLEMLQTGSVSVQLLQRDNNERQPK